MGYFLKKFISQFLMPLPLVFEVYLLGWLLAQFSSYKRTGQCVKGFAILLLIIFGYGLGAEKYLYSLERLYPSIELRAADFANLKGSAIVVLGQGFPEKSDLPLRFQANASFLQRLEEGMRLYRMIPDAKLLVSMAGDADRSMKEQFVDAYALEHSLKRAGIQLITSSRDTSDEVRLAIDLAMTNRLVIVTSATHLPRAVKIASKELVRRRMPYAVVPAGDLPEAACERRFGFLLIPFPCDYLYASRSKPTLRLWDLPLPSAEGFRMIQHAFYEGLGNRYEDMTD